MDHEKSDGGGGGEGWEKKFTQGENYVQKLKIQAKWNPQKEKSHAKDRTAVSH